MHKHIVYTKDHKHIQCDSDSIGDDDGGGGDDVALCESVMCRENIDGIYNTLRVITFEENSLWRRFAASHKII